MGSTSLPAFTATLKPASSYWSGRGSLTTFLQRPKRFKTRSEKPRSPTLLSSCAGLFPSRRNLPFRPRALRQVLRSARGLHVHRATPGDSHSLGVRLLHRHSPNEGYYNNKEQTPEGLSF